MIRWGKQITKHVMASPATIKDNAFFAALNKKIYCFQMKDGSTICDFETGDKIWSSPSIPEYAAVMFFGSLDSHIYGKFPSMNIVDSSAAIGNKMMFIGSHDDLFYVWLKNHTSLYRMTQILGEN